MTPSQTRRELIEWHLVADALMKKEAMHNPDMFAELYFGEPLDDWQSAALRDLLNGYDVCVRACNGAGKARLSAVAVNMWLEKVPKDKTCVVITMSASGRQVRAQLWGEIRHLRAMAKLPLQGNTLLTEIHVDPKRYAIGFSTDEPGNIEGFHADEKLVVLDEAKSLPQETFDAVERLRLTGKVRFLIVSSTGSALSPFARCFTTHRSLFKCYHVPAVPLPSTPWVAKRINPVEVERAIKKFGEQHPLVISMVFAEFTRESEGGLIPLEWVEAAFERWRTNPKPDLAIIAVGVDVAREGDDSTVLAPRSSNRVLKLEAHKKEDTMQTTGHLVAILLHAPDAMAIVDVIGIGAGVVDRTNEQGYQAVGFNAGAGTSMTDSSGLLNYGNCRSAAWWNMRELLDPANNCNIELPPDDELLADLTAPTWTRTSTGKIAVEPKETIKKKIKRSTDRGDAVVQAFWPAPQEAVAAESEDLSEALWRQRR